MTKEQFGALFILIVFIIFMIWGLSEIWKENPTCIFAYDTTMCLELTRAGVIHK